MTTPIAASFRDPAGFVFRKGDVVYRQVNKCYAGNFSKLHDSGLYQQLVKKKLLIPHTQESGDFEKDGFITIKPEQLLFISQPYEWSFNQLKDAALATLTIQKLALRKGMSLKDASAYNIQFHQGNAIFIDTLSFEAYQEGTPWIAYRQFCQHFLAPLALMAKTDISLNQLLKTNIDGVGLELASKLLPAKTWLNFGLLMHIHLHAKSQQKNSAKKISVNNKGNGISKNRFLALIDSLQSTIKKLQWHAAGTEWHDYYQSNNNYENDSLQQKQFLIEKLIENEKFNLIWDLGANTGRFSRAVANHASLVCAWDIDPACVDNNYLHLKSSKESNILPLLQDLTNPSAGIGWANQERESISERAPVDLVMALGLIHHLAISNNLPLAEIAKFLARIGRKLIIEFVPKEDSQVQKLLQSREDIFFGYTREGFETCFSEYFELEKVVEIPDTVRSLYLMVSKNYNFSRKK